VSTHKITAGGDVGQELWATDTVSSVLEGIQLVLSTPKGTVPMYRDFGLNMDFLDMPYPGAEQMARAEIREAVERWEPRATVTDVTFVRDGANGRLIPTVEVEIHGAES